MNITAKTKKELYLMSALLCSSTAPCIIYNIKELDKSLKLDISIPTSQGRFMGQLVIQNLSKPVDFQCAKLECLSCITLNHQQEIEVTTNLQIIKCTVLDIDLYFWYDEDMPA